MNEVRQLARRLMDQHGLSDWSFSFSERRSSAGRCIYPAWKDGVWQPGIIEISLPFVRAFPADTEDTLLHEIAHALTPGDGHGLLWQEMCRQLGARPSPYTKELPGKWRAMCCEVFNRQLPPGQNLRYFCPFCGKELIFHLINQEAYP